MAVISGSDCIRCYFESGFRNAEKYDPEELQVFYAKTEELRSRYDELRNYISDDEHQRANRFYFDSDRETYIACHASLRLVLAIELNTNPLEISFINGVNNKPSLAFNPLYFNITHTREAFAFAISRHYNIGIDLENINLNLDLNSITKNYFSKIEREFILQSESEREHRFFLLWTRKEALLKAMGAGIIDNLTQVEVSGQNNFLDRNLFDNYAYDSASDEHFIYSTELFNNYLSIATPRKVTISIDELTSGNIPSYPGKQ